MSAAKQDHRRLLETTKHIQELYHLSYESTNRCIQCGYCLPVCPTYQSMGKEAASPRGRINLVKMASEGKIDISADLAEPIDLCLGCRTCEKACPVDVPYGHILESAKKMIADSQLKKGTTYSLKLKNIVLKNLFPYPKRIRALGNSVWFYQKVGLQALLQKSKIANKISEPIAQLEKILPKLEAPNQRNKWGVLISAKGKKKARVAFFAGCISDGMLSRTNRLTIELLTLIGCEVIIPKMQKCCGALHIHQGLKNEAKRLAMQNIEAFEEVDADFFVNNAGGCGAMLREYDHLFAEDKDWYQRAIDFVASTRDITEILVKFGPLPFTKEWRGLITYQDSCHLRNVQGVHAEPRILLKSIPGAIYVDLPGADSCCASGGIYNILHFEESMKMLDKKMEAVLKTEAKTVVTTNPGCLLQMKLGIERTEQSNAIQALHLVEVLAKACGLK